MSVNQGRIDSIAFSPDGRTLASSSMDRSIRLWELVSGKERRQIGKDVDVGSIAFSPDGMLLAGAGRTRAALQRLDMQRGPKE